MNSEFPDLSAVSAALGEPPCEAVMTLSSAAETLLQLEAIFSTLNEALVGTGESHSRARTLARAGQQLAGLTAGVAESRVLELRAALERAGWWPAP